MKNLFSNFLKEEEGSIIEYVLLIAVMAVIIAILFPILKGKMGDWFGGTMNNMDCGIGDGAGVNDYTNINYTPAGVDTATQDIDCGN